MGPKRNPAYGGVVPEEEGVYGGVVLDQRTIVEKGMLRMRNQATLDDSFRTEDSEDLVCDVQAGCPLERKAVFKHLRSLGITLVCKWIAKFVNINGQ